VVIKPNAIVRIYHFAVVLKKTFARHEVAKEVLLRTEVFWDVKGASSTP
jgi:hypothetical protein